MTDIIIDEHNKKLVDYLKNDFQTNNRNLLIIGSPWIGKTYLATKLSGHNYMIDEPTFRQMINERHLMLKPNTAEYSTVSYNKFPLDALSRRKVVIYDDLGSGQTTEAYKEKMLYWINKRLEKWLKTIYTTNKESKQALEKRDPRIASRLMMNADIYVCQNRPERRQMSSRIIN